MITKAQAMDPANTEFVSITDDGKIYRAGAFMANPLHEELWTLPVSFQRLGLGAFTLGPSNAKYWSIPALHAAESALWHGAID